jgi:hypothetical protein
MEGFNWITYKKLNLDLQQVGLKTKQDFEKHWINYGKAEGRKCSIDLTKEYPDFNWLIYKQINPDLTLAGLETKDELEDHFIEYGRAENRTYIINPKPIIKSNKILVFKHHKDIQNNKISLHLLLPTIGRHSIFNMLDSIAGQISCADYLTIVYDGIINSNNVLDVIEYIRDWKCNIKIYIEIDNLGYWGHSIRNMYRELEGDFILHIDDDDILHERGLEIIRSNCVNTNYSYIFCFKMNDKIFWEYPDIKEGNIGTPCGVIPIKINKLCSWGLKYGGDYNFYLDIKKHSKITFIQKVIYIANHNNFRNISRVFYTNNIDSDKFIDDCMNNSIDINNILKIDICGNILQCIIRLLNYSITNNYNSLLIVIRDIPLSSINIESDIDNSDYIYLCSPESVRVLLETKKTQLINMLTLNSNYVT